MGFLGKDESQNLKVSESILDPTLKVSESECQNLKVSKLRRSLNIRIVSESECQFIFRTGPENKPIFSEPVLEEGF